MSCHGCCKNLVNNALPLLPESYTAAGVAGLKRSLHPAGHSPRFPAAHDNLFLANYANLQIETSFPREGVGQVQAFGAGFYAMRIWLDLDKLNYLA